MGGRGGRWRGRARDRDRGETNVKRYRGDRWRREKLQRQGERSREGKERQREGERKKEGKARGQRVETYGKVTGWIDRRGKKRRR